MTDLAALIDANRAGRGGGLPCFCTANDHVLRAILDVARETGFPTVIEATCNQVNQDGGYTGMQPADFFGWVHEMAEQAGVPPDQVILGGDHLGPNPWRKEPPQQAMAKARALVRLYVEAGFRKIHLDASMACGGEPPPSFELVAARAADLCAVAEAHAPDPGALVYIIGTEVPIPGGETEEPDALDVTSVDRMRETIATHRAAFARRGLMHAWPRIVSVVTQPGVDFSHSSIWPYDPAAARALSAAILDHEGLTYEAHSTDYQPGPALAALVRDHFFFLKVGPELTFRFREAVLALAGIETALGGADPSDIAAVLARRMAEHPAHWADYYKGDPDAISLMKRFSYSDRIRYYWTDPAVRVALSKLLKNLSAQPLPRNIVSQFFLGMEVDTLPDTPEGLLRRHVQTTVRRYFEACGLR